MTDEQKLVHISARVTIPSKDMLRRIAASLGISMSDVLEISLRGHLDLQDAVHKELRQYPYNETGGAEAPPTG